MTSVEAVKPWHSIYAEPADDRVVDDKPNTYDDQETIDKCMECQLPVCVNCLDKRLRKRRGEHYDDIVRALQEGRKPEKIAAVYGVNIRSVNNIKKVLDGER